MRRSLFGALLGASLVIAVSADRGSSETAFAPPIDSPVRSGSELITHVSGTDSPVLTVTVVDPKQRVMAVYHVDRASGALQLKSVRNLQWDLMIEDYNSASPAPRDIRALKEQQR